MASSGAKKEAKSLLGKFDSSGYKEQQGAAKSIYDTSLADAENQWTNLQNRLTANRKASATDFSRGRSNVSESDYLANRVNANRRATGGLDTTGFDTASNLGNRMELGRQYSNLANTYYNALEGIDRSETEGQQAYDIARRQAGDIYNSALANINLAKQGAQNQYNAQLASLAEGIQSRWDANANAAAARAQQQKQFDDEYERYRAQLAGSIIAPLQDDLTMGNLSSVVKNLRGNKYTIDQIKDYLDAYGINYGTKYVINPDGTISGLTTPATLPKIGASTSSVLVPSTTSSGKPNLVSPTPYQDLLNKSNPYFNR